MLANGRGGKSACGCEAVVKALSGGKGEMSVWCWDSGWQNSSSGLPPCCLIPPPPPTTGAANEVP